MSGRFVSREEMLAAIGIGVALTLLSWGAGAAARYFVNKSAETPATANDLREADLQPGRLRGR